jgi:predicted transcriptional regulator
MAAVVRSQALDFAADLPDAARKAIAALLVEEPKGARRVYAALARKVWSLLVERRFDDEIRDWHDLLHGVKAHIRGSDDAAAERLAALADLLRESISLAQTSPAREVADRPRARRILEILHGARGFVARRALQDELAIGSSHLSNVLTQLLAHDLVDRRDKGKEAEFRITALGRQLIGADGVREESAREREVSAGGQGEPSDLLAARVQHLVKDELGKLSQSVIIMGHGDTRLDLTMIAMPSRMMGGMGILHVDDTFFSDGAQAARGPAHLVPGHAVWPVLPQRKPATVHKLG